MVFLYRFYNGCEKHYPNYSKFKFFEIRKRIECVKEDWTGAILKTNPGYEEIRGREGQVESAMALLSDGLIGKPTIDGHY